MLSSHFFLVSAHVTSSNWSLQYRLSKPDHNHAIATLCFCSVLNRSSDDLKTLTYNQTIATFCSSPLSTALQIVLWLSLSVFYFHLGIMLRYCVVTGQLTFKYQIYTISELIMCCLYTNACISQSFNQSINKSINQSTNQSF